MEYFDGQTETTEGGSICATQKRPESKKSLERHQNLDNEYNRSSALSLVQSIAEEEEEEGEGLLLESNVVKSEKK